MGYLKPDGASALRALNFHIKDNLASISQCVEKFQLDELILLDVRIDPNTNPRSVHIVYQLLLCLDAPRLSYVHLEEASDSAVFILTLIMLEAGLPGWPKLESLSVYSKGAYSDAALVCINRLETAYRKLHPKGRIYVHAVETEGGPSALVVGK